MENRYPLLLVNIWCSKDLEPSLAEKGNLLACVIILLIDQLYVIARYMHVYLAIAQSCKSPIDSLNIF